MSVVGHRVRRVSRRPGDVVHERADRDVWARRHGIADDDVADPEAAERLAREQRAVLRRRGLEEEPADERDPETAVGALPDDERDAADDEEVPEPAADQRRHMRRPAEVSARSPERRAQHPAAVERERGEKVEDEQREVDVAEPGGDGVHHLGQARFPREEYEDSSEDERDERAGDGDAELGPRGREHPSELRHAAEQPERDPLDLDAFALRFERMAEFVREEGCEEEERGDDRHRGVRAVGMTGVLRREDSRGERPDDQREDDQPAPVHAEANAGDAAQRQAVTHAALVVLADLARDLDGPLRDDRPVLAGLPRCVLDDLPALLRRNPLPAPLGLQRERDELPGCHPRHVHITAGRAAWLRGECA